MKTLRTCNTACDTISATAFATSTFRQYDLHKLVYYPVKAQTNLNANHVVRAIANEAEPFTPEGVIGIDLGIVNVATDSESTQYTGEPVKRIRKRYRRLRQLLQTKKTRSARKHLQKARRKESRFVTDTNRLISKHLVQLALDRQKALACEVLTGIR